MKSTLIFLLAALGLYLIFTVKFPHVYPPAAATLRKRSTRKISQTDALLQKLTTIVEMKMELEPLKRMVLQDELQCLGYSITPERFRAQSVSKAILLAPISCLCSLLLFAPPISLAIGGLTAWAAYHQDAKKLRKAMQSRRERIERELPQFASTIHQALHTTYDVISIFESYRKVCGPELRTEIDKTLNEMKTGNPERALKSFESRIASAELSQLTRGLVGVLRGDDRRNYFEMLAMEYQKKANEAVEKELLLRPQKLYPYFGLLFACLVLLVGIALGLSIVHQSHSLF